MEPTRTRKKTVRAPATLSGAALAALAALAAILLTAAPVPGGPAGVAHGQAPDASPDAANSDAVGQDAAAADALVDRWIEALGGMETYWKLRSARYTLTTQLFDPATGRLRRARPRYVTLARLDSGEAARVERWEGDDFIQHGFDGQSEWAVMNGEPLGPGDKDWDEARYVASDVFYWIGLPFKLKDPGVFLHHDGTDEDGRQVVRVTFGEGVGEHNDTWFYAFEEGRAMPVSIAYREEGRTNASRTYWEDVREVDGYVFAGRRVHVNADGRVWKVLETKDFVLNPEVDPSVFRSPM